MSPTILLDSLSFPRRLPSAMSALHRAALTRRRLKLRVRQGQSVNVFPRALPKGVDHVYDQALRLIVDDSKKIKSQIHHLTPLIQQADQAQDLPLLQSLKKKLHILQVQSQVNLPHVRWQFIRGVGDMSKPVFRHLAETKWRKDGALDLAMERIYQMNIVPDVLPAIHPTLDLRVLFNEPPPRSLYLRTRARRRQLAVEQGSFLLPEQTRRPPTLYVTAFHPEPRLYTLIMIDPDYPDPEAQSYHTYLHWIHTNVQLDSTTTALDLTKENYIPPHPQQGSPYHRYTILLLQNPEGKSIKIDVPHFLRDREQFNVRQFCSEHGFNMDRNGSGGGVFMWREVWDKTVSDIYENTLQLDEPRFGKVPKFDRYRELKEMKKYI